MDDFDTRFKAMTEHADQAIDRAELTLEGATALSIKEIEAEVQLRSETRAIRSQILAAGVLLVRPVRQASR